MAIENKLESISAVERLEDVEMEKPKQVVGTVQLIDHGEVVLVPTPTTDPRDPLNLPNWRKILIITNVSIFAATATLMASSFGAILPVIYQEYGHQARINDLVTFPALFIGLGNFIFVPIAHAVGRRPVYLFSLTMLVLCCLWCAKSQSLSSHIAGRNVLSLAAGQAEALCPIMVQEIYFLHQRAQKIAWFCALQVLGTASLTVASSYLASNLGWRWWYGTFAIINSVVLICAIFFVVETKFDRSAEALTGNTGIRSSTGSDDVPTLERVTTSHRPAIDYENYPSRTLAYDLSVVRGKPQWSEALRCWKQMFQVIWFPNILWLVLCSGAFLGIFVMFGAVFAGVLVAPPYNFSYDWIGFVFAGQVVVSLIVIPLQGYLSDYITKFMSRRNNGVAEPEHRLLTLILPFCVAISTTVIFGRACQHPYQWHWSAIAVTFNAEFYGFVGIVVASFTYAIDSYPTLSDASLVVLCFARGVISFGISYGALEFIQTKGYDGAFDICAIILGILGFMGIGIFVLGKRIRAWTQRVAHIAN